MHLPPDLSLASSYIPACLCLFKCTLSFILFIFAPVRGWIGLFSVLVADRILWNQAANSTILDVNAVCVALVGGLMVVHTRADGLKTLVHFGITGAWIMLSSVQILGATRLHRAYEVLFAAFAVSVLSCLYQAQERTELLALRSFVFVVANATLPYIGVMLQHPEIDTYVNVCRTLLILLGEPEIASAWLAVYIICIGYQVRSTSTACIASSNTSKRAQNTPKYAQLSYYHATDYDPETPPQQHAVHCDTFSQPTPASIIQQQSATVSSANAVTCSNSTTSSSEEAALLREALANRKGH
jgi:hypothetical protein